MKFSLQYKLMAAFMIIVILVLAGVTVGGSVLIRDYFINRKRHELSDKAYEMARVVNAYYDGNMTHSQLHNFVDSVDHFLDARVWVVDNELNLITVSEERADEGQLNRRGAAASKPSPMHHAMWDCELADQHRGMMMQKHGQQQTREQTDEQTDPYHKSNDRVLDLMDGTESSGKTDDPHSGRHTMMRGHFRTPDNQQMPLPNPEAKSTANLSAAGEGPKSAVVLDIGQESQSGGVDGAAISLADIKGMDELSREIKANSGKPWSRTYYHPYYEENMLIVAVPLAKADGTISGTVMINAPIGEINDFLQHVYYYIGLAGLAAILFAALLAAYMARGIVRPLRAMRETAAAMACGDYERRVAVAAGDEIGDLGQSLNSLAGDLGEYIGRMQKTDQMRRDFVANVSHELRTPLTIIHGYNQALQDGTVTDQEKINKYHHVMGDEILRLEKLIAELLDLSQLQAGSIMPETESVLLAEVVDNVMMLLKQKSEQRGVRLAAHIDSAVPPIQGDGDRLTQLVLILMDNALKFTPSGGEITAQLMQERGEAVLIIADTGAGIAPDDLPYIWERFYKADKSRASHGTGLGLAIARQIIELHGATVAVASVCGEGTAFTIRFPIELKPAER